MKLKIFYLTAIIALVVFGESCTKQAFENANQNPNAPAQVTPGTLLSTVEGSLAYTQGGDISRFTGLYDQQLFSSVQQAGAYYTYIVTDADFDTQWGNMYTSVLQNNQALMALSDSDKDNRYSGVSRIIMAYSLQLLVDNWGSVPYSTAINALNGGTTTPTYDNDRALYDTIASLINVGIAQLSDANAGPATPGGEDVIYGGNAGRWIKLGHAIKARLYIHQSKGNPAMAALALTEANAAFASNADNAQYIFGSTETSANPVYQFDEQRGYIDYPSSTLADTLDALTDPRYNIYLDSTYSDVNGDGIGDYYGNISGHTELITYDEMLFVKAEAILRSTGDFATAELTYDSAITANMTKLGVAAGDIATYLVANGTLPITSVDDAIAKVSFQEYLALYLNPEAYTLWRRTGSPALTPTAGSNGIPRRFLYPNTEYTLNGANTPASTSYTPKVFWDN
jgi:hypothetical protein